MLIDVLKYSESLKDLWLKVFGDDKEYINLIFDKGYSPCECFGYIENDRVISALYFLKCNIKANGCIFEGRYLYAAATLPDYRGQGIMSGLINEAKEYIHDKSIDFISLVPASKKLYDYYGKFGFRSYMYNYESVIKDDTFKTFKAIKCSEAELYEIRSRILDNAFMYDYDDFLYASDCLRYAGYEFYKIAEDSYFIVDEDMAEVLEYASSEENFIKNTEVFLSQLKMGTKIVSFNDLSSFIKSDKKTYGMIYTYNDKAEEAVRDGIYMNIALD